MGLAASMALLDSPAQAEASSGLALAQPPERAREPSRCLNESTTDCTNDDLITCYQDNHCLNCLDALLEDNARLLWHVLKRFPYAREPSEDLFQVARMGLLKAAQRFDRSRGISFGTYAVAIVDGEVRHHLRDNLLMRQPRWARGLYRRIREAQAEYYDCHRRLPSVQELAQAVNVAEDGVLEVLRVYAQLDLHSLDEPLLLEEPMPVEPDTSVMRSLRYESFALPVEDRIALYEALAKLSAMQKRLIYLLFFKELSQQEVAAEMGVSQRTISREQTKALSRLRAILTKRIF